MQNHSSLSSQKQNTEKRVHTKFKEQDLVLASRNDSQVQQWTMWELLFLHQKFRK